jgi:hypothetical protein
VTGPCVTATIDAIAAGTSQAKTGATVSLREVDIDITFRLRTGRGEKIFGGGGYALGIRTDGPAPTLN